MSAQAKEKHPRLLVSPLRYPGGKGSLYPKLREIVRANDLVGGTYVEPFAGGAGAGLALLLTGEVRRIVINDLDPAIYAFWRAALRHPSEFAQMVMAAKVTVPEWRKQREIHLTADRRDYLRLGFATFYLNRTNHSGVLNGGPIGGLDQSGKYKIDARFNRQNLLERLRVIELYQSKIVVLRWDGSKVIDQYARNENTLVYADPPYFEKAGSLYLNSFAPEDHASLAQCLNGLAASRWVLTYDDVPQVRKLYHERRMERFSLNYSAHRTVQATEIMVYSDGITF